MDNQEKVKKCYDWKKDNIKSDSWAKRVKEVLEKNWTGIYLAESI
jgi:hypothetical protein